MRFAQINSSDLDVYDYMISEKIRHYNAMRIWKQSLIVMPSVMHDKSSRAVLYCYQRVMKCTPINSSDLAVYKYVISEESCHENVVCEIEKNCS